jgi:hypothetical protein
MSSELVGLVKVGIGELNDLFPKIDNLIETHEKSYYSACNKFYKDNPGKNVKCFPFFWKNKYVSSVEILKEDVCFHFGIYNDIPSKLIALGYTTEKQIAFCGNFWYGQYKIIDQYEELRSLVQQSEDGYIYLSPSATDTISRLKNIIKEYYR